MINDIKKKKKPEIEEPNKKPKRPQKEPGLDHEEPIENPDELDQPSPKIKNPNKDKNHEREEPDRKRKDLILN
jgi:hypothetical protein